MRLHDIEIICNKIAILEKRKQPKTTYILHNISDRSAKNVITPPVKF